ncbi:MAG: argininosuccinate lyase [Legionellales bacterium RIFCSPHIGHO2_12_FULL_37_14]|nr:MAG: argininosuccinate lyase [Legionellales bacterium RIFCSPHIGHO2_12_FULL_37_14]
MSHKTWGGGFSEALDVEVNTFQASLPFDHILYEHDIEGSIVHARMLAKVKLITRKEAALLVFGLRQISQELKAGLHPLNLEYEDVHMFIENLLLAKVGEVAYKLHTGRSRNDQVALDLRLYVRHESRVMQKLLAKLIQVLQNIIRRHKNDLMPGYTHLQQAQPISLANYLDAYKCMFGRDKARLKDLTNRLNYSPLGAGALAGSNLPLDRAFTAKELGFKGVIANTLDAVSDRDFLIEFGAFAAILMMHMSRFAEDLIIYATQEFGYVTLPDAFATGSSLMPNKKNPDVLELIRGKSGRVFGHLMGILTIMKALPLAYNKDMQEDKEGLFDTVATLKACLKLLPRLIQKLEWNIKKLGQAASSGYLDATKLVETLVLQGMPFRKAHHQVGISIKEQRGKKCQNTF